MSYRGPGVAAGPGAGQIRETSSIRIHVWLSTQSIGWRGRRLDSASAHGGRLPRLAQGCGRGGLRAWRVVVGGVVCRFGTWLLGRWFAGLARGCGGGDSRVWRVVVGGVVRGLGRPLRAIMDSRALRGGRALRVIHGGVDGRLRERWSGRRWGVGAGASLGRHARRVGYHSEGR